MSCYVTIAKYQVDASLILASLASHKFLFVIIIKPMVQDVFTYGSRLREACEIPIYAQFQFMHNFSRGLVQIAKSKKCM